MNSVFLTAMQEELEKIAAGGSSSPGKRWETDKEYDERRKKSGTKGARTGAKVGLGITGLGYGALAAGGAFRGIKPHHMLIPAAFDTAKNVGIGAGAGYLIGRGSSAGKREVAVKKASDQQQQQYKTLRFRETSKRRNKRVARTAGRAALTGGAGGAALQLALGPRHPKMIAQAAGISGLASGLLSGGLSAKKREMAVRMPAAKADQMIAAYKARQKAGAGGQKKTAAAYKSVLSNATGAFKPPKAGVTKMRRMPLVANTRQGLGTVSVKPKGY